MSATATGVNWLEVIAQFLTEPRALKAQTLAAFSDMEGFDLEQAQDFIDKRLPELEDYELDILLSPEFTPSQAEQLACSEALGEATLSAAEVDELLQRLEAQGLKTPFELPNAQVMHLPLGAVVLERFVKRLPLAQPLTEVLAEPIRSQVPSEEQAAFRLMARDPLFEKLENQKLFQAVLQAANQQQAVNAEDFAYLVDFLRTYKPKSQEDLKAQLERLIASCKADMENLSERSYHNEQLRANHAGSESDYYEAKAVEARYTSMIHHAEALLKVLH